MINGFYTYKIPDAVMVDGVFYVGWRQRSETFLNAGYDVNTPNAGRQFFWLNGEWKLSQVEGSVMIRAVVGDRLKVTAVNDIYYMNRTQIKIWPNPANDYINLNIEEIEHTGSSFITIIDMHGRELIKVPFSEQIDVSSLKEGMYIIITSVNGKPASYNRLIKTR